MRIAELTHLLEQARQIIADCEEAKEEQGSEYGRTSEELTAYRELKELLLKKEKTAGIFLRLLRP